MLYFDFHTHRKEQWPDVTAIVNVGVDDVWDGLPHVSVGVHPWEVGECWREQVERLRTVVRRTEVVAIGECGLDRVRGGVWEWQMACFEAQLILAREVGKPVVIHCVRAFDELLAMKRRFGDVGMVVHGFRGGPVQARQLMQHGLELSFGPRFHADSLRAAYEEGKMWLETDDSDVGIQEVYERASSALSISPTDIPVPGTLWF